MVFSNLIFVYLFLPLCLIAYYTVPTLKLKNYVLLVFSIFFYALGEPAYVAVIIIASGSAFYFARLIDRFRGTRKSKLFLVLSVVINVSFLFFFKYFPFFIDTANKLFSLELGVPKIALPIGISFYTFQILTYTIDIYMNKTPVQKHVTNFFLYVSFFPQLIAGPIVRYNDIEEQFDKRSISTEQIAAGIMRFVCGMSKKLLIADYAGKIADSFLGSSELSTVGVWFGILMYSFQIYFDFSGYSDMAIGLGKMFGFEFLENFNYPYISRSITEFWRRWHMSLGTFFRDYVYIPLGGNRKFQLRNIAVVWLLTGFWHGASWNFALWGIYFGVILIIEKYVFSKVKVKVFPLLQWIYSFLLVVFGWIIFYYHSLGEISRAFKVMFLYTPSSDFLMLDTVNSNLVFLFVCFFAALPFAKKFYKFIMAKIKNENVSIIASTVLSSSYILLLLFVNTTILIGSSFSPFLYFRF